MGECGSVLELLLSKCEVPGLIPIRRLCCQFTYPTIISGGQLEVSPKSLIQLFLGFLGMLNLNMACILCYLNYVRRYWSFFVGTLDSCSRFLKHVTFLVKTRQYDFAELRPLCKQSEMQQILDSFEKKNRKRINNGFGIKIEIENIQLF